LTPAAHRPGFFLATSNHERKKAMTDSFIDYWDAVDAAMLEHFGADTGSAGIRVEVISDGYDGGWTPEDFAFWCGVNFELAMLCERGA
jgi:hypothetical protein